MAFHQTTRHGFQRTIRVAVEDEREPDTNAAPEAPGPLEQSQTWVLFSPATDTDTATSYLSSVQESQQTPGRSRLSDLGSLNTLARSDRNSQPANSAVPGIPSSSIADEESVAEDDAELDSLDSHLPDFRSVPNLYHQLQAQAQASAPVLPTHDGLGSFRLDTAGLDSVMQERIYAFEQFNPRRVKRRRESLELAQLQIEHEQTEEIERNRRIEAWRLEQSRLLLDQIRRETRRRRLSEVSSRHARSEHVQAAEEIMATTTTTATATATATSSVHDIPTPDATMLNSDWHEQDGDDSEVAGEPDGLWSRITRKFMREVLCIDEKMLSILLGETLPDEEDLLSTTPKASAVAGGGFNLAEVESHDAKVGAEDDSSSSWQLRMLDRIAKELGLLVHRMSSHPGAFSTYVRVQQAPLPYAGLPVIPEAAVPPAQVNEATHKAVVEESTSSMPLFRPTIYQAQPIAIPGKSVEAASQTHTQAPTLADTGLGTASGVFTQQEWEQDLDIKLVFKYLRSRFTSRSPATSPGTSHLAASSTQLDAAAKVARVRQHHPLVGRGRHGQAAERRSYRVTTPSSPAAVIRHGSTCASQSTRRSGRRSSVSSRHYWDIGGSIGTGSMIASTGGPMGSWGEV